MNNRAFGILFLLLSGVGGSCLEQVEIASGQKSDSIILTEFRLGIDKKYSVSCLRLDFEASPNWDPLTEVCPLDPSTAAKLAINALKENLGHLGTVQGPYSINLARVKLDYGTYSELSKKFAYTIEFLLVSPSAIKFEAKAQSVTICVLLNGKVATLEQITSR
jgi:hypothetical protein